MISYDILSLHDFQLPLGISTATGIRVGQHVGAGDTTASKTAVRVGVAINGRQIVL